MKVGWNKVEKVFRLFYIFNILVKILVVLEYFREEYISYIKIYFNVKIEDLCYIVIVWKRNEGYVYRIFVFGFNV